jgi:hypothetical protein
LSTNQKKKAWASLTATLSQMQTFYSGGGRRARKRTRMQKRMLTEVGIEDPVSELVSDEDELLAVLLERQ